MGRVHGGGLWVLGLEVSPHVGLELSLLGLGVVRAVVGYLTVSRNQDSRKPANPVGTSNLRKFNILPKSKKSKICIGG